MKKLLVILALAFASAGAHASKPLSYMCKPVVSGGYFSSVTVIKQGIGLSVVGRDYAGADISIISARVTPTRYEVLSTMGKPFGKVNGGFPSVVIFNASSGYALLDADGKELFISGDCSEEK